MRESSQIIHDSNRSVHLKFPIKQGCDYCTTGRRRDRGISFTVAERAVLMVDLTGRWEMILDTKVF